MVELRDLPYWPARLGEDDAARYLGISKTTFRDRWQRQKTYPQPINEGRRLLWGRRQLERFVDAQYGLQQPAIAAVEDNSWDDFR